MKEGMENLNYFIDLDEYKAFKNLLRMNGVTQEDREKEIDRSAANSAGGVKTEVTEVRKFNK